ncbi:dynein intermediate chain 3, ciliary, partial [Teleopsis dalmanni]|uniref:dynein intermediate chain 3, ciliary n=1 Tax=Teleopsis dalmanni TaxID=139649 RepID=UPI0018CCA038
MHQSHYTVTRERRRFGRQCLFTDRHQLLFNIVPKPKHRQQYILRNPVSTGTQLGEQKAESYVATDDVAFFSHGVHHYEGGWPREVNINDEDQTLRHRKKVEREDNWGSQVTALIKKAIDITEQNNTMNIYECFFEDLPKELGADIFEKFEARQVNLFHDLVKPTRPLLTIDWLPTNSHRFLTHYSNTEKISSFTFENDEPASGNLFFTWDTKDPIKPVVNFDCKEAVCKVLFCPKDDVNMAGGLFSGKICIWESQNGGLPTKICPLEVAHREPVAGLCWVHSKSNSEFYTGSIDGSIKYWDFNNLEDPLQEVLLDPEPTDDQSRDRAHGCTVLEFEYTIPVRYIIGTDQGFIFVGNRKGITPSEALINNYKIFAGPIRTIERNPFFVKSFLITGDWCGMIWAEEVKNAPSTLFIKKNNQIMCGTWSTARCSLFVTGDSKGELDFWDLLLDQKKPIFTYFFQKRIINCRFRPDGKYLAVALADGDMQLLELDSAMKQSSVKEKALIAALFEREQLRCKLLEGRVEEIKLKHRLSEAEAEAAAEEDEEAPDFSKMVLAAVDSQELYEIVFSDEEFRTVFQQFKDIVFKTKKKQYEREFVMERTEFEPDPMVALIPLPADETEKTSETTIPIQGDSSVVEEEPKDKKKGGKKKQEDKKKPEDKKKEED